MGLCGAQSRRAMTGMAALTGSLASSKTNPPRQQLAE